MLTAVLMGGHLPLGAETGRGRVGLAPLLMPHRCKNSHCHTDDGNQRKEAVDFDLAPAAHLKGVVDRRHAEDALAVGRLLKYVRWMTTVIASQM